MWNTRRDFVRDEARGRAAERTRCSAEIEPVNLAQQARAFSRSALREARGVLLVIREPVVAIQSLGQPPIAAANLAEGAEPLLALWRDGSVSAFCGHVDLGTGLATALAQLVAEELNVELASVEMRLGDTAATPNQGATIASASIQIHAYPLRYAAAQAALWLRSQAALRWQCDVAEVGLEGGGLVAIANAKQRIEIDALVADAHYELQLDTTLALKPPHSYRVIGTSPPRRDIEAKAKGELIFVHDMRLPGMLHGRVIRPPYAGLDHGDFVGTSLLGVNRDSIAHVPGVRAVVTEGDFIGVVADREEHAEQAMHALDVRWQEWPGMPNVGDLEHALRTHPATQRLLVDEGDVDAAIANASASMSRTYLWPYQLHASLGPSCALAQWFAEAVNGIRLRVWSGTQNPHVLRADLAKLMRVAEIEVDVVRMEASGCYGRNGADDVSADAALLARAAGRPVRVQLTREQENQWEPKGAAQLMSVRGGVNADGSPAAYDFEASYPSNASPTLALLLTRTIDPVAQAFEMGDRTARPPYSFANLRVAVNDMPPILRASWLRGVSALPNSFAHESYIDELAVEARVDPVEYRMRLLDDPRARELIRATTERAQWCTQTYPASHSAPAEGEVASGQGFAYARYVHSKWPGYGAAWSAWVADVEVNRRTGEVQVKRVVVGHDAGLVVNPSGVAQQVHGNVIQTTSRALKEKLVVANNAIESRDWGSYPILSFREVPVIEVVQMPRPYDAPLGAGESSSIPGTAAIANAIFDATGVRFRQPPFTPEVIREGLRAAGVLQQSDEQAASDDSAHQKNQQTLNLSGQLGGKYSNSVNNKKVTGAQYIMAIVASAIGAAIATFAIFPTASPIARIAQWKNPFSQETIDRGRELAALGNCVGCHSAANAPAGTGGRAIATPFGAIYTTNLTPHIETGIGGWSLAAFTRALRDGVSRDGRHLYPAFPFTSFAQMNDEDITAIYAFLMNETPHAASAPANELRFPYNQRALLSGWKGAFHDTVAYQADPTQSDTWNRGAYLVQSIGHCGACHSPRNTLGAERADAPLAGAMVNGWYAPALTALSTAPVAWTQSAFYDYLRLGHSQTHGAASGAMAEVVRSLSGASDADLRAMATYLAAIASPTGAEIAAQDEQARAVSALGERSFITQTPLGAQLFSGACRQCHYVGNGPPVFGLNIPLAFNSHLHSAHPDNLVQILLDGIRDPVSRASGYMPAFREVYSDEQIAALLAYLRERYAPEQAAWTNLRETVASIRALTTPSR